MSTVGHKESGVTPAPPTKTDEDLLGGTCTQLEQLKLKNLREYNSIITQLESGDKTKSFLKVLGPKTADYCKPKILLSSLV